MENNDFLSEYNKDLRKEHEEAGKDFEKGEDKYGRDMDDRIGYQHDILQDLLRRVKLLEERYGKDSKPVKDEEKKIQQRCQA